jgi:hypothetical protein
MHDPVSVFEKALACLQADDFAGAAACCDPVSLRAFQRQMVSQYVPEEPIRPLTIEDMLRAAPDMPRDVAEYHVRQRQEWDEQRKDVSRELPGISDGAALRAASGEAVFAAYLLGKSYAFLLRQHVQSGELTESELAASQGLNSHRLAQRVIGTIAISERLSYLFYVTDGRDLPVSDDAWVQHELARIAALPADERDLLEEMKGNHSPQSVLCRRQPDGSWRLIASHDFLGAGGSIIISRHERTDDE